MIDKETLSRIAKLNNMKPWQQEKHYIQAIVLVALSEFPLVFKGGTYLWFFHDLPRFSEDLDFTASGDLPKNIAQEVSESVRLFGIENSIKIIENKARGISFRLSAKGPLNTSERDLSHVYVEISRREHIMQESNSFNLNFDAYKLPLKIIRGATLEEIAAEKVRATITRDKARDAYDLYFLIKHKKINFDLTLVNEKLKYYDLEFSKSVFKEKLNQKKQYWVSELQQLVFGELPDFDGISKVLLKWIAK
jgi:predicted nucleotidyltransferase component of viral defense system